MPQTPGNLPSPNSATDWLMPNHLNLPGAEVGPGAVPVLVDVVRVVVGDPPPVPGRHCEYLAILLLTKAQREGSGLIGLLPFVREGASIAGHASLGARPSLATALGVRAALGESSAGQGTGEEERPHLEYVKPKRCSCLTRRVFPCRSVTSREEQATTLYRGQKPPQEIHDMGGESGGMGSTRTG